MSRSNGERRRNMKFILESYILYLEVMKFHAEQLSKFYEHDVKDWNTKGRTQDGQSDGANQTENTYQPTARVLSGFESFM